MTLAKILIFTQFFPPETNAGARRVGAMAETLGCKNDLVILTPSPGYPSAALFDTLTVKEHDEKYPGHIIRCNAIRPHHPSLILRALAEIGMAMRLTWRGIFVRADFVIVSTPSMFLAPFAWLLARLKGARFIYDLRDLTWRYVCETANRTKFNELLSSVLESLMTFILRRADLVVCNSPGIAEVLCDSYMLLAGKIVTIMNGISDEMLTASHRCSAAAKTIRPIVTYIGLFGHNQGIEVLLEAAKQLPAVDFFLIGDGPDKENIIKRTTEERIGNLTVTNYITSLEELANYYHQSTLLIIHLKKAPAMRTVIPSKIFEYMAFGKPIIYAGEGVAVDFLRDIGCAIIVPPDSPCAIAQAISELLKDAKKMEILGEIAREYVNKHCRRNELMSQLGSEINKRFDLSCRML